MNVSEYGSFYKFTSSYTSFPHKVRMDGYSYQGKKYAFENHYNDSTVALFVPRHLSLEDSISLVFYFHGWWNSIDQSISDFNLIKQFHRSKINGILVLPESAKNAADSFGGKLEEKNNFKSLVSEVIAKLKKELGTDLKFDGITLAGHSGAYRVISYILMRGGMNENIRNVYIFDGLYGQLEKFTHWIDNYDGRFINIYTPDEGTKDQSENLAECLISWQIPFKLIENDEFSADQLENERIIIIKSNLNHNQVISSENQFQKFLESSL